MKVEATATKFQIQQTLQTQHSCTFWGGLNLPALTSLYKHLQVSRQCQLLISPGCNVRLVAKRNLWAWWERNSNQLSQLVHNAIWWKTLQSRSRRALSAAAKRKVTEEDDIERRSQLRKLEKKGQIIASVDRDEAKAWANTIQSFPSQLMGFTLNAAMHTLPHNANLHLWGKKDTDASPHCGERQTLIHVLNCCRVARELHRYDNRHNGVLGILADVIKKS